MSLMSNPGDAIPKTDPSYSTGLSPGSGSDHPGHREGSGSFHSGTSSRTNAGSPSTAAGEETKALQAFGKMQVSGQTMQYVGNEHWAAILDDIAEVKKAIGADEDDDDSLPSSSEQVVECSPPNDGPDLLLDAGRTYSKADLLDALPPRMDMDRLVSRYFNSSDPLVQLLHLPTFETHYERFWMHPESAPTVWLALLYAIMSQATFFESLAIPPSSPRFAVRQDEQSTYRRLAAQCLIASNYMKPVRWTLEALALYMLNEYTRRSETLTGVWVVLGMLIRLAMRLGYHRDPSAFPQISVFAGEMRRRMWTVVLQLDMLSSVQFGLPRMIRFAQTDTQLPGNFLDEDLYEGMAALPAPRPDAEHTAMSYHVFKGRLTWWMGRISDEASNTQPAAYEQALHLDAELTAAFEAMPLSLRTKSAASSITDPPGLIMKRFTLEILYHKGLCVLHRRYVARALTNERYAFSRMRSLAAAKAILHQQAFVFEETQPGGRVHGERWMMSGLTTEDFTLAAMVLCLNLDAFWEADAQSASYTSGLQELKETGALIERSHGIWSVWSTEPRLDSLKATKACQVLSVMLRKIKSAIALAEGEMSRRSAATRTLQATETVDAASTGAPPDPVRGDEDAGHTDTPLDLAADGDSFPELAPVTDWIDAPQDIDWAEWDDLFRRNEAVALPHDAWLSTSEFGEHG